MLIERTALPEVLVLTPRYFRDERGFFTESYNKRAFAEAVGSDVDFVQDNHSRSSRGVLRGLHFQLPPNPQAKLVRVAAGAIFDVAVDMRRSSSTFGRWAGVELSAENQRQLWIPEGFAHGFLTLSDSADVLYKTNGYYSPADEGSLVWDDPEVGIEWPLTIEPILSGKDQAAPGLADAKGFA